MSSVRNEQDSDVDKIYQNEQHPINYKNQKRTYVFKTLAVMTNLVMFFYIDDRQQLKFVYFLLLSYYDPV